MKHKRRYKGRTIYIDRCSKCQINPRATGQRWCLSCHAENMRKWRQHTPLTEDQKLKSNCRSYAKVYLKRGKITKQPCSICGSTEALTMKHEDYTKPLELTWRCREHRKS